MHRRDGIFKEIWDSNLHLESDDCEDRCSQRRERQRQKERKLSYYLFGFLCCVMFSINFSAFMREERIRMLEPNACELFATAMIWRG